MPSIFVFKGCKFFFYSNEGEPREPLHVHVRRERKIAKFWLDPELEVAYSNGFSPSELNELLKVAGQRSDEIRRFWDEHFSD